MTSCYASTPQVRHCDLDIACNGGQALSEVAVGERANRPTGWKPFDASAPYEGSAQQLDDLAALSRCERLNECFFAVMGVIDGRRAG